MTPGPTDICLTPSLLALLCGFQAQCAEAPPWRRLPCSLERDLETRLGKRC